MRRPVRFGWLCWGLTSQSTIFQSCRDGAIASWVINQYFRGVKCLAQGHNTAAVGLEPRTSRSGVRHSTTEPPRSPDPYALSYPGALEIFSLVSVSVTFRSLLLLCVCSSGDHTFKSVPGIHGIPGKWSIRILLWYANFQALFRLKLQNY